MCVPFGKILRGKVVPNTVTKTLHTDKVYEPDLNSFTIEPFPYYSPLKSQIETIKSFDRPVILVDDLVHTANRLQVLVPQLREDGIPIKKVVVGVLSGYGRDLMQCLKVPVESIYSMPNLRQWFVESTLYPFIGGDTVRREEMKVAGLQPSINMILPYATPRLPAAAGRRLWSSRPAVSRIPGIFSRSLKRNTGKCTRKTLPFHASPRPSSCRSARIREAVWSMMRTWRRQYIWRMIWRRCGG